MAVKNWKMTIKSWKMAIKKLEDGWKIALSFKLSSSHYHIHHQPITPFLEDMADFFTYSYFISARLYL